MIKINSMEAKFNRFEKREIFIFLLRTLAPKEYPLKKIGKILKVTPERIRQIEAKTCRKIRHGKVDCPLDWILKEGKINGKDERRSV